MVFALRVCIPASYALSTFLRHEQRSDMSRSTQ